MNTETNIKSTNIKWKDGEREWAVEEFIKHKTLISTIANTLYPDLPLARERENKLLEIPEMQRLKEISERICNDLGKKLYG